MMPVPELVVLGPYDLGVNLGHPDVPDAKIEKQQQRTGKDMLLLTLLVKKNTSF